MKEEEIADFVRGWSNGLPDRANIIIEKGEEGWS